MTTAVHTDRPDHEIVALYLRTQEESYFDAIYKKYASKVYAKCISLLESESDAYDAMQEIFLKIITKLSRFTWKSKLSTWIYSITYNHCIDVIRKKSKSPVFAENDMEKYDTIDEIEDSVILETQVARLKEVLNLLGIEDRSVLLMKYMDEMSIVEISGILNKSESAVKMQIKRAKEKFRKTYNALYKD